MELRIGRSGGLQRAGLVVCFVGAVVALTLLSRATGLRGQGGGTGPTFCEVSSVVSEECNVRRAEHDRLDFGDQKPSLEGKANNVRAAVSSLIDREARRSAALALLLERSSAQVRRQVYDDAFASKSDPLEILVLMEALEYCSAATVNEFLESPALLRRLEDLGGAEQPLSVLVVTATRCPAVVLMRLVRSEDEVVRSNAFGGLDSLEDTAEAIEIGRVALQGLCAAAERRNILASMRVIGAREGKEGVARLSATLGKHGLIDSSILAELEHGAANARAFELLARARDDAAARARSGR